MSDAIRLVLTSLECKEVTDGLGSDNVFITADGMTVWGTGGGIEMDEGDTASPIADFDFNPDRTRVKVVVFEYDTGSDHDVIGEFYALRSDCGTGEKTASLTGDGSRYTLTYKVVK